RGRGGPRLKPPGATGGPGRDSAPIGTGVGLFGAGAPVGGGDRENPPGHAGPRDGGPGGGTPERGPGTTPAPHPVHDEPVSRVAGVSSSGLPVRQRRAPQQWPAAGKREGAEQRPGTGAPRPSPRRRDSRQVSDVLAAYAQGINRSTNHRGRSAPDDNTERTEK
ncbi:histidine kinase, partial [Streptomyces anulatus]